MFSSMQMFYQVLHQRRSPCLSSFPLAQEIQKKRDPGNEVVVTCAFTCVFPGASSANVTPTGGKNEARLMRLFLLQLPLVFLFPFSFAANPPRACMKQASYSTK